jgi:hypothetical protein
MVLPPPLTPGYTFAPPPPPALARPYVFRLRSDSGSKAKAYFWGGVGLLILAGVGLFFASRTRTDALQLQLMTNLPTLFAIGCFSAAYAASKAPSEVTLFDDRVEIRRRNGTTVLTLADLSMATVAAVVFTGRRKLRLFDRAGRCAAVIPDAIDGFDDLAAIVQAEVQRREDDQAVVVRMRKARRQAVLLAVSGVVFAALVTTLFFIDRAERRNARLLAEQGQPGEATILRHFTAPNGRTRRIEYRVTDASGATGDHNVEVQPVLWDVLAAAKTVPVVAVPGRPDLARLALGEVKDDNGFSPRSMIFLYVGGGVLCLFLFVGAILNWKGIDIDLDSKTGKISIKRFGAGT